MNARHEVKTTEGESDELLQKIRALPTTSARIRALHATGMKKGDIVRYLNAHFRDPDRPHDYRYQHVHNVLGRSLGTTKKATIQGDESRSAELPERLNVHVDSAGRVLIPAVFRSAMQVKEGDRLLARVVDGELRLITPMMAVRLAQKMVRETIPGDDSLVESLLEERRREFEREMSGG
jgi:bifunctional DNA-binding transcriptional regulator/antitoxin component of YhaV-PrlF toxin-antitoxin module